MERQPGLGTYPAWRRALWRAVAALAYHLAATAYDVGGWAMQHLPECRLHRDRYQRIWNAIIAAKDDAKENDDHDW